MPVPDWPCRAACCPQESAAEFPKANPLFSGANPLVDSDEDEVRARPATRAPDGFASPVARG